MSVRSFEVWESICLGFGEFLKIPWKFRGIGFFFLLIEPIYLYLLCCQYGWVGYEIGRFMISHSCPEFDCASHHVVHG